MEILRIHFQDSGQDFTHWDVDPKTGLVVDCQPFQYSFWCDGKRRVKDIMLLGPGRKLRLSDGGVLKHTIERVEVVPADWLHMQNLAKAGLLAA